MREVNAIFITLVLALFVHVIKTFVYWVLDLFLFYTYKLFQLGQSCLAASMIRGYSRVQHSTIFFCSVGDQIRASCKQGKDSTK